MGLEEREEDIQNKMEIGGRILWEDIDRDLP